MSRTPTYEKMLERFEHQLAVRKTYNALPVVRAKRAAYNKKRNLLIKQLLAQHRNLPIA